MLAPLLGGCLQRQSVDQREHAPDPSITEAAQLPRCVEPSAGAIALLDPSPAQGGCALVLERDDEGLLLVRALGREGEAEREPELLARGPAPEACGPQLERCELWGASDVLGPVVLASVRGHESEVPTQVYVGWREAERLVFAETWYGLSSIMDHTRVGPAWALAPFDCGGELLLLPAGRLPEAQAEGPDASLVALAGRWVVNAQGLAWPPAQAATVDPGSCRALFVALP